MCYFPQKSIKNICEHFIDSCFYICFVLLSILFLSFLPFSIRKHNIVFSVMTNGFRKQMIINTRIIPSEIVSVDENYSLFSLETPENMYSLDDCSV